MAQQPKGGKSLKPGDRRERLAAELRANLLKRKDQARRRERLEDEPEPDPVGKDRSMSGAAKP